MTTGVGMVAAVLVGALALGPPRAAPAQTPEEVIVRVGGSTTFPLPRQPQTLSTEDPDIAIVEVLDDGKARVTGRAPGETRVVGRDHAQVPILIDVRVQP